MGAKELDCGWVCEFREKIQEINGPNLSPRDSGSQPESNRISLEEGDLEEEQFLNRIFQF